MKLANLSFFNLSLIVIGLIITGFGLHRMVPLKLDKAFMYQNVPLMVFLALGMYFFFKRYQPGKELVWGTVTANYAGRFLPLMVLLCLVMGIGGVLLGMYKVEIESFLMKYNAAAPLIGSLSLPTPSSAVPIIDGMWSNKKLIPNFLFFLNAASLMSIPLFMLRSIGFANREILLKMYLFGIITAMISFPIRTQITWVIDKALEIF